MHNPFKDLSAVLKLGKTCVYGGDTFSVERGTVRASSLRSGMVRFRQTSADGCTGKAKVAAGPIRLPGLVTAEDRSGKVTLRHAFRV